MNGSNVCIWKIDRDLKDIIPLLKEKYFKEIRELSSCNISQDEKRYIYKWLPKDGADFIKQNIIINNNKIEYLEAIASLEIPSITSSKFIIPSTGEPLPKDMRVNVCTSKVIFIKRNGYIYCVVLGSKSLEGKIRSNLLQSRNRNSKWGEIIFNNVPEFSFNKDFYYWILMNKGKKFNCNGKNLLLEDVEGFKSSTERHTHSYNGEGSNIDEEIPLKSIISTDGNLESLYMKILYGNIMYSFYLDYNGRMSVMFGECGEHATQSPKMISDVQVVLTIYFEIIPFMIKKFNEVQKKDLDEKEFVYRKRKSLEVIKTMAQKNNIVLNNGEIALTE